MAKRGRRPAGEDTRATIVDAARRQFGALGYAKTTLRGVAREAGVDPALIHHYFEGKADLFTATFQLPDALRPKAQFGNLLTGTPADQLGAVLLRDFLTAWDSPEARETFVAIARSAMTEEDAARATREFLGREFLGGIIRHLHPEYKFPELRAGLITSTLWGIGVSRWVNIYPPVADATIDLLVWYGAPAIQHYLDGPIAPEALILAAVKPTRVRSRAAVAAAGN